MRAFRGSDRIIDSSILAERFWKACQREGESPVSERKDDMAESEYIRHENLDGMGRDTP